jgi:uncharacterized protein YjiS (DUF1127 family)
MSVINTVHHANHGSVIAHAADTVRHAFARFADWRKREAARKQALRNMQWMSERDFHDIGISRAALQFHLNHRSSFH